MRGVGDELTLQARRLFQRRKHRVETAGEAAELVLAGRLDSFGEVAGLAHTLRGPRETAHGCQRSARDEETKSNRDCDAAEGDHEQKNLDSL